MTIKAHVAAGCIAMFAAASAQSAPSFDLTGVWNSSGGGVVQIFQKGEMLTMLFVGPDFAHRYEASYVDPTTVNGTQVRVTRATGCTVRMNQTFTANSGDVISVQAVALARGCGFVKGQLITDVLSRAF